MSLLLKTVVFKKIITNVQFVMLVIIKSEDNVKNAKKDVKNVQINILVFIVIIIIIY